MLRTKGSEQPDYDEAFRNIKTKENVFTIMASQKVRLS